MSAIQVFAFADEASPMISGQIAAMKRNSLQGLEIRNVDGENVSAISESKAREVKRMLDGEGLRVWSIGSPIGKIDIEKDDFEKHLDTLRHTIDIARILHSGNIRMFSFYLPGDKDPSLFQRQVMDQLHRMVEAAEGSGVALCHENDKGIYGDNAARCLEILNEVPAIHGVFDPANFVQVGQDTWEAWQLLKDKIAYLHIKDALFGSGSVVPAGKGDGNVEKIVKEYVGQGGQYMTVEPHLAIFEGLKALERPGEESAVGQAYSYPSRDAAFDAACDALRGILANV